MSTVYWIFGYACFALLEIAPPLSLTVIRWGGALVVSATLPPLAWLFARNRGKSAGWILGMAILGLHFPADMAFLLAYRPGLLSRDAIAPAFAVYTQFLVLPPLVAWVTSRRASE